MIKSKTKTRRENAHNYSVRRSRLRRPKSRCRRPAETAAAETAPSGDELHCLKRREAAATSRETLGTPGTTGTTGTMVPAAVGRARARGAAWWPRRGARQAERTPDRFFSLFLSVFVTHINYGLHTVPPQARSRAPHRRRDHGPDGPDGPGPELRSVARASVQNRLSATPSSSSGASSGVLS